MQREMKIGIFGAVICAALLLFGFWGHETGLWLNHTEGHANPVSMDGHWHQTNGTDTLFMAADVEHGNIKIDLTLGTLTGVYWDGSFDTDQAAGDNFQIISQSSNPDGTFSSHDPSKTFTYKDGVLSYQFTIRGTTRTVELSKGA